MRARNEKMIVSHDARDTYTGPFSMHYTLCARQSTAPRATKRRALYLDRVSLKDQYGFKVRWVCGVSRP